MKIKSGCYDKHLMIGLFYHNSIVKDVKVSFLILC